MTPGEDAASAASTTFGYCARASQPKSRHLVRTRALVRAGDMYYSRAATMDLYEALREFVDSIDITSDLYHRTKAGIFMPDREPLVLQTLAKIRDSQPFHYTIVGDGYLRDSYEKLTRDLGLAERITFTGFLDRAALNSQLLDSDLFILTTSQTPVAYEGFGLVYLEANACGCPVLAARIGGSVEAVEEGVSGMFVDEPTVDGIGKALARFFSGAARFDADACVAFARKFSWAKVADHCLAHYSR